MEHPKKKKFNLLPQDLEFVEGITTASIWTNLQFQKIVKIIHVHTNLTENRLIK